MERIEFNYVFRDEDGKDDEERIITISKREEDGLHDYQACAMFLDFIRSVGFSEENIYRYFQE